MITTYVINLKGEKKRREYMEELLEPYIYLDIEFIEAVNGKELTQEQIEIGFDEGLAYRRYGRELNRGEIGCTLSHYKCYKKLLNSEDKYALIIEDDITILNDLSVITEMEPLLNTNEPLVLFLSGDYWYKNEIKGISNREILSVYDAVGTYAYFINKAGAKLILEKNIKASCAADNWSLYRSQGLKMKAIYPYLIDANIESFDSTIKQSYFGEHRMNMSWKFRVMAYWNAFVKKILLKQGKFVPKNRK